MAFSPKIVLPALTVITLLFPAAAYAITVTPSPLLSPTGIVKQLGSKLENRLENLPNFLNGSTISVINPSSLIIVRESKSYTVNIDAKTQLRRRFWGKSELSEMQVGDKVNVIGKWTDNTQTALLATLIRDLSLRKRNGVFIGTVQSVTPTTWVVKTPNRGTNTVTYSPTVKVINRKGQIIKTSDIAVGHVIRVRGLWDTNSLTITEVVAVKDYTLPPAPTVSITPVPTI